MQIRVSVFAGTCTQDALYNSSQNYAAHLLCSDMTAQRPFILLYKYAPLLSYSLRFPRTGWITNLLFSLSFFSSLPKKDLLRFFPSFSFPKNLKHFCGSPVMIPCLSRDPGSPQNKMRTHNVCIWYNNLKMFNDI